MPLGRRCPWTSARRYASPIPVEAVFGRLRALPLEQFRELVAASPRAVREEVFRRTGIKARRKGGAAALQSRGKADKRIEKLHEALSEGLALEDRLVEEMVRNYLYTRRPLLADAMDFLEVEHDEGLTNADLDFMQELDAKRRDALRAHLSPKHDAADVELYLSFMGVPLE